MPCIRRRYHAAAIYIDDEVPELIGKFLVGSQLDVLLKNGDFERMPFGGFCVIQKIYCSRLKL